jgi:hypothetical protein
VHSGSYVGLGRGVEVDDDAVSTCAAAKVVEETKKGRMRENFMLGSEVGNNCF